MRFDEKNYGVEPYSQTFAKFFTDLSEKKKKKKYTAKINSHYI